MQNQLQAAASCVPIGQKHKSEGDFASVIFPCRHFLLKFLFFENYLVNNHRVFFMRLDTLTKGILTERMHRLGLYWYMAHLHDPIGARRGMILRTRTILTKKTSPWSNRCSLKNNTRKICIILQWIFFTFSSKLSG